MKNDPFDMSWKIGGRWETAMRLCTSKY